MPSGANTHGPAAEKNSSASQTDSTHENPKVLIRDEPRLIAWLDNAPEQLCGFIHAIFPRCGPCSFDAITEPQFPATLAGYFSSQVTRGAYSSDLNITIQLDKLLAGGKSNTRRVVHQTPLA